MLVQTHFPRKLAPQRYDQYLASGWFRGSVMLYKVDLMTFFSLKMCMMFQSLFGARTALPSSRIG